MLPKFASHLLHHTSRAAATAQNYAFRNVLGLQNPSTTPGGLTNWSNTGSSSWGGYGTGAGGAKYNTGNRFYSGYSVRQTVLFSLSIMLSSFVFTEKERWSCCNSGQLVHGP